ncbi:winged helix-turn-helix domain-containing protein [Thalassomonas viridans]|uniref:Winged helix-turn-helix domain-containing protein n=1 Tax=Thalassomonas viridans TaxID=137584 RepID=A0AAF0CCU7_9GAMM|nr:transcriptional regulator [Thalassomonas viridans]WDE07604.1 winged helix-turn-helix domain-containing protein [Thalassomonas viridans]
MSAQTDPAQITIADWTLNLNNNILSREDTQVQLENKQSQLLAFLATRPGEDITKSELLQQVWHKRVVTEDVLYVCIAHLRKALGDNSRNPSYIKTIPGVGYKLLVQPDKHQAGSEQVTGEQVAPQKNGITAKAAHAVQQSLISGLNKPGTSANVNLKVLKSAQKAFRPLMLVLALIVILAYALNNDAHFLFGNTKNTADTDEHTQVPANIRDDYQKARYLLARENPPPQTQSEAIQLLQHAITLEPGFAPAYALLGELKYRQFQEHKKPKTYREAQSLINNALQLAPGNKAAHLTRANMSFWQAWDFPLAEHHYRQASGTGEADHLYAQFLLSQGKYPLAHEYSQKYISANPEAYSRTAIAWIYTMGKDYEKGYQELMKLAPYRQESFAYHVSLQAIYELQGQDQKAAEQLFWLMGRAGYTQNTITEQRRRFAAAGLSGLYHWLAFEDKQQYDLEQYAPPLSLARYAISAGDHASALKLLQQAVDQRQHQVLWLSADPKYDAIRHKPEFQQLLAQIGL